jgi:four helix bundle protein
MAQRVEDLKVWQRAREFCVAINAIIDRAGFQRDRRLRDQLMDAVDSVIANISEGFAQPNDRAFARYLFISKASNAEARTRLLVACDRGYLTAEEFASRSAISDEVARMITGLIKYLLKSDRRDRGLGPREKGHPYRRLKQETD